MSCKTNEGIAQPYLILPLRFHYPAVNVSLLLKMPNDSNNWLAIYLLDMAMSKVKNELRNICFKAKHDLISLW